MKQVVQFATVNLILNNSESWTILNHVCTNGNINIISSSSNGQNTFCLTNNVVIYNPTMLYKKDL